VTRSAFEDLPRAAQRRLVLRAVVLSILASVCLVVAYYELPMDKPITSDVRLALVVGLLLVTALIAFQARAITRSPYPRVRAIAAFATSLPLFLLVFATVYFKMGGDQPGSFSQPMTRTGALYFTMTVFSSVGFGDITPKSETARIATMVQMLGDLLLVGERTSLGPINRPRRSNVRADRMTPRRIAGLVPVDEDPACAAGLEYAGPSAPGRGGFTFRFAR
jgi:voltage-gated potassium channel